MNEETYCQEAHTHKKRRIKIMKIAFFQLKFERRIKTRCVGGFHTYSRSVKKSFHCSLFFGDLSQIELDCRTEKPCYGFNRQNALRRCFEKFSPLFKTLEKFLDVLVEIYSIKLNKI